MSLNQAFEKYMFFVKTNSPELCGDFAAGLPDEMAKALYAKLEADPVGKNCLVRPLWFSYERQAFRWEK